MELWKPVVGHEGNYEISSEGRVRSLRRGAPKLMSLIKASTGYRVVNITYGAKRTQVHVHAMVLEAFVGPRPDGQVCRHLNGDPADNRLCNLSWGSQSENLKDRERHGTDLRGSEIASSRFVEGDILEMRKRRRSGEKLASIAESFATDAAVVSGIVLGKSWAHLPGALSPEEAKAFARGEAHHSACLDGETVVALRRERRRSRTRFQEMANRLGLREACVREAVRGKTWAHVQVEPPVTAAEERGAPTASELARSQ